MYMHIICRFLVCCILPLKIPGLSDSPKPVDKRLRSHREQPMVEGTLNIAPIAQLAKEQLSHAGGLGFESQTGRVTGSPQGPAHNRTQHRVARA